MPRWSLRPMLRYRLTMPLNQLRASRFRQTPLANLIVPVSDVDRILSRLPAIKDPDEENPKSLDQKDVHS